MGYGNHRRSQLWRSFPTNDLANEPLIAFHLFDDFWKFDADESAGSAPAVTKTWLVDQATAGTATLIDGQGGLLKLDAGASTADQGVQVQSATEIVKYSDDTPVFIEAYITGFTNHAKCQFFFGLSVLDTTLFDTGENSSANHIGFEMNATSLAAGASKLQFVSEASGTRSTEANVYTVVDDTDFILGFKIENGQAQAYINGSPVGDPITTNIPTTELAITLACLSEGTSQPTVTYDWIRVGNVLSRTIAEITA